MERLIAFILPAVIDTINTHIASSTLRFWISVIICTLFGALIHYVMNDGFNDVEVLATDILAVFGIAQLVYKGGYENSQLRVSLKKEII